MLSLAGNDEIIRLFIFSSKNKNIYQKYEILPFPVITMACTCLRYIYIFVIAISSSLDILLKCSK